MDAPPPPSSQSPEPLQFSVSVASNGLRQSTAVPAASIFDCPNPSFGDPPPCVGPTEENPEKVVPNKIKKKAKQRVSNPKDNSVAQSPSPSSSLSSSSSSSLAQRGTRVASKRRNPRVVFGSARRSPVADAIAFRFGMSIAAFSSQILERKDTPLESISADHLALICASAVKESLANDFGDTFDSFVRNFEKSFSSTFRTLKVMQESSVNKGNNHLSHPTVEGSTPDMPRDIGDCVRGGGTTSSFGIEDYHTEELFRDNATEDQFNHSAAMEQNEVIDTVNLELALHGQRSQLSCVSPSPFGSMTNQSTLSTIEKSVMEQTRSNDLKTLELSLSMKKLKLKEDELALNYDSNNLERSKLAMGISKASFKVEKFKTQLEDVRHAELLRKCIDCLVAGLFTMVGSILYATYVHSYHRITDATASCTPSSKESNSWWIPNPVSSINSGFRIFSCHFQAVFRMLFGVLMIISVAYLLLQRSSSSKRTMPVTFIVLLLAFGCGFAGKVCVDTLGGSGYHWLLYWETICLLHFFCNVCTSTLFFLLHGPDLNVSPGMKCDTRLPYWTRRFLFYGMLVVLPLLCGLIPFAGLREWTDHFFLRIADYMSAY